MPSGSAVACNACGASAGADAKFCSQCGHRIRPADCVGCGAKLAKGARYCAQCGVAVKPSASPSAMASETSAPTWTEERKLSTVVFGDISGFTAISSRLEPDAVREFANACFKPLSLEVERRGGTVVKYIGDCIMAVFGVPVSSENDPERAVRAALAMSAKLKALEPTIRATYGSSIAMRIGVNTGVVMVGSVGGGGALDVMGSAVNLASRIEGVAEPGQVVIGPATFRLVEGLFDIEPQGAANFKGFEEPVPIYQVLTEKPEGARRAPAELDALEASFLVRPKELEIIKVAYAQVVRTGKSFLVTLVGDSGTGKARLLLELQSFLEADPHQPEVFSAAAVAGATGSTRPFSLLGRMIRSRFDLQADEDLGTARDRVMTEIAGAWGPSDRFEGLEAAGLLANVAGLPAPGKHSVKNPIGGGVGHETSVLAAFAGWIERLARRNPVCLIAQELQWADDASLEQGRALGRALKDIPVLMLYSARSEFDDLRPGWWEASEGIQRIDLLPLSNGEMRQFLDHLLRHVADMPGEVIDSLVTRAEGNLEYARELVRLLIDQGALQPGHDNVPWRWVHDRLGELRLPETVQGVLQARIDSLLPTQKEILKAASVAGRTFWQGLVEQVVGVVAPDEIAGHLDVLVRRGIIKSKRPSVFQDENEYIFRSQAFRDVVYDTIPTTQRQKAHRKVATFFQEYGSSWNGGYAELAGHLEAGGAHDAARLCNLQAARHAAGAFANADAAVFFERAFKHWPLHEESEQRATARRETAVVLRRLGMMQEAITALEQAETDLRNAGVDSGNRVFAETALERAYLLQEFGRVDAAIEALDRGLELVQDQRVDLLEMELLAERAFQRSAWNDAPGSQSDCRAGLEISASVTHRDHDWQRITAKLQDVLGMLHVRAGELDEAESAFKTAVTLRQASHDSLGRVLSLINLGGLEFYREDLAGAIGYYEEALVAAKQTHWVKYIAVIHSNLGQAMLAAGDLQGALKHLEEAIQLAQRASLLDVLADGGRAMAEATLAMGQPNIALSTALDALQAAERSGSARFEAEAHRIAMQALLAGAEADDGKQARDEAHRHLREAVRILRRVDPEGSADEIARIEQGFKKALDVQTNEPSAG